MSINGRATLPQEAHRLEESADQLTSPAAPMQEADFRGQLPRPRNPQPAIPPVGRYIQDIDGSVSSEMWCSKLEYPAPREAHGLTHLVMIPPNGTYHQESPKTQPYGCQEAFDQRVLSLDHPQLTPQQPGSALS